MSVCQTIGLLTAAIICYQSYTALAIDAAVFINGTSVLLWSRRRKRRVSGMFTMRHHFVTR